MAAGCYLPLAAVLLATAVTLLVATSAVPVAAAAAAHKYSGRMVIIRAPAATVVSAAGALNKWQQQRRRLVEDEVAPEFGDGHLLGDDRVNKEGLKADKAWCPKEPCAARGGPYTRPCQQAYQCPTGPNAEHASRAMHV